MVDRRGVYTDVDVPDRGGKHTNAERSEHHHQSAQPARPVGDVTGGGAGRRVVCHEGGPRPAGGKRLAAVSAAVGHAEHQDRLVRGNG